MGEHRVDQVAARRQPLPRPLPPPDEILEIGPAAEPARSGRPVPRLHGLRRMLRSRRGKWVLIGLACVAVLLVGLLAQGFLSSPAPSVAAPGAGPDTGAVHPTTPHASRSGRTGRGDGSGTSGLAGSPIDILRAKLSNPLNHLHGPGVHDVVISASSGAPMTLVGYLVPTGMGSTYGVVKGHPRSWSVSEQALGRGYLAAIFVQTNKRGTPITCEVRVDGTVTTAQTASGGYGRAVCLG